MRKKRPHEPRESLIGGGWTVEDGAADDAPTSAARLANDDAAETVEAGPDGGAASPSGPTSAKPQLPNSVLVLLGVFGGLYLLYVWVWLSWAQYYAPVNASLAASAGALGGAAQSVVYWIAPLAPIFWFVTVLLMNRGKRLRSMVVWIVIGAVVLVPLPAFDGWVF